MAAASGAGRVQAILREAEPGAGEQDRRQADGELPGAGVFGPRQRRAHRQAVVWARRGGGGQFSPGQTVLLLRAPHASVPWGMPPRTSLRCSFRFSRCVRPGHLHSWHGVAVGRCRDHPATAPTVCIGLSGAEIGKDGQLSAPYKWVRFSFNVYFNINN